MDGWTVPVRQHLRSGLDGPGRLPAVRGRAVALRVEPPGYRRLAPDGLPSLTQHSQAGRAGGHHAAALSRARGSRAFLSVMLRMTDARLAIGPARRSLRCASLGARSSRTPPRPPAMPGAGPLNTDALKCSQRLDRRAIRCARWHVGRGAAAARDRSVGFAATAAPGVLAQRPRRCAGRGKEAARAPVVPPRSPHGAPVNW